jgi:hypothetical protein
MGVTASDTALAHGGGIEREGDAAMVNWDLGYRHIVDVDGQLLAIDADLIDVATLLKRADISPERQV